MSDRLPRILADLKVRNISIYLKRFPFLLRRFSGSALLEKMEG